MRSHTAFQFAISALLLTIIASGCGPRPIEQNATSVPIASDTAAAPAAPAATVSSTTAAGTPAAAPVASTGVLYQDDFTDPSTGWPEAKFDNYFIGYHEPEYYHIEVDAANSRAPIFMPGKKSFGDATLQVKVQVNSKKTAASGNFAYGLIFRRSGDQYYAFVISPRGQKWLLLKSSPSALTTLAQGADSSLHAADADDLLRVDAKGSTFSLEVNGRLVAQVTDSDYTSGEVGFYVQSYDIQQVHIHFDQIIVGQYEAPQTAQPVTAALYHNDFTDPSTGWPEAKFDNYFIGYHEPEYYHIEVDAANSRASIFMPGKKSFGDATLQVKGQVNSKKTAANGDFIWGIAFRRSGDQYYAFVISPRGQKWLLLKSSPSALTTLAQGADSSLHAADADDLLRVDAKGSTFSLEVNGRLVAQVTDSDYTSGEVGFYVQSYDIQQVHIHFDELTLSDFEAPWVCHVATTTGLNLHSTPGSGSFVVSLSPKEALQPLGHSLDDKWVYVRVQTSGETGWVSNSDRLITCNADIAGFPIIVP